MVFLGLLGLADKGDRTRPGGTALSVRFCWCTPRGADADVTRDRRVVIGLSRKAERRKKDQ
jgi:hypothetical protein